jgi:hypothetical protein
VLAGEVYAADAARAELVRRPDHREVSFARAVVEGRGAERELEHSTMLASIPAIGNRCKRHLIMRGKVQRRSGKVNS